jgi:hypothetical protein
MINFYLSQEKKHNIKTNMNINKSINYKQCNIKIITFIFLRTVKGIKFNIKN